MVKIGKGGDRRNEASKGSRVGRREHSTKARKKGRLGSRKRRKVLR